MIRAAGTIDADDGSAELLIPRACAERVQPISRGRFEANPVPRGAVSGLSPLSLEPIDTPPPPSGPLRRLPLPTQYSNSSCGGGRAAAMAGGSCGTPRHFRMRSITSGSKMSAISSRLPRQFGQRKTSTPNTRCISSA